ncbi:FHA domain-containing protein [Methylobacterium sp. D48H]
MKVPSLICVVGRDPDLTKPYVKLLDQSISRVHATISHLPNDRLIVEDLDSSNGTYLRSKGIWKKFQQRIVDVSEEIRFGRYTILLSDLLQQVQIPAGRVKFRRNPETGEIIQATE